MAAGFCAVVPIIRLEGLEEETTNKFDNEFGGYVALFIENERTPTVRILGWVEEIVPNSFSLFTAGSRGQL